MVYSKDFTVIIPHSNSLHLLPKLLDSIPESERIEVIIVDNSSTPITKNDICINRDYKILYSNPERGAGGARNVGIENALGKWLVFADADDYFTANAFDIFNSLVDSRAEMIYTMAQGVYLDSGEPSDRGAKYERLVREYCSGKIDEYTLRFEFSTPWAKMVSHELVNRHNLRYDEVVASNDIFFSLLTGFYARKIVAVEKITYIVTVSRGTLTRRRDYQVSVARFEVSLRRNKFLRDNGFSDYQTSIMARFRQLCKNGVAATIQGIKLIVRYRQNPFIGYNRWGTSYKKIKRQERKEIKYITH